MGRVFSPEELGAGHYPQPGAHALAAEQIIEQLQAIGDSVTGALIYGSEAMGYATRRSDLDILVRYNDTDSSAHETQQAIEDAIARVQAQTNVYIEPNIIGEAEVAAGTHQFAKDLPFIDHLVTMSHESPYRFGDATRGFTGLSDYPAEDQLLLAREITERYLEIKVLKFEELAKRVSLKGLQRALELPSAISRKLQICEQPADDLHDDPAFYRRKNLEARLQAIAAVNPAIAEPAAWLVKHDQEYTELLEDTIARLESGAIDRTEILARYGSWVTVVSPLAIKKAMELAGAAGEYLESQSAAVTTLSDISYDSSLRPEVTHSNV